MNISSSPRARGRSSGPSVVRACVPVLFIVGVALSMGGGSISAVASRVPSSTTKQASPSGAHPRWSLVPSPNYTILQSALQSRIMLITQGMRGRRLFRRSGRDPRGALEWKDMEGPDVARSRRRRRTVGCLVHIPDGVHRRGVQGIERGDTVRAVEWEEMDYPVDTQSQRSCGQCTHGSVVLVT